AQTRQDAWLVKEFSIALTPHLFWDGVLIRKAYAHIPRVEQGHLCGAKGKRGVLAHRSLQFSRVPLRSAAGHGAGRTLTSYPNRGDLSYPYRAGEWLSWSAHMRSLGVSQPSFDVIRRRPPPLSLSHTSSEVAN